MAAKKKFKNKVTISLSMERSNKEKIEGKGCGLTDFINQAINEKLEKEGER